MAVVLKTFDSQEIEAAQEGLEDLVRALQIVGGGEKITENHWHHIYSTVRKSPVSKPSSRTLRDYCHHGLGVEYKLMQDVATTVPITRLAGDHKSAVATRKITFDPKDGPTACKDTILQQFGNEIDKYRQRVSNTVSPQ